MPYNRVLDEDIIALSYVTFFKQGQTIIFMV